MLARIRSPEGEGMKDIKIDFSLALEMTKNS